MKKKIRRRVQKAKAKLKARFDEKVEKVYAELAADLERSELHVYELYDEKLALIVDVMAKLVKKLAEPNPT